MVTGYPALAGRKRLIIGRKGAGKSAICMMLTPGGPGATATGLVTLDDASREEIRRFELDGLGSAKAKVFWRMIRRLKSSLSLEASGVRVGVAVDAPSDGLKTNNQLEVVEARVAAALRDLRRAGSHGGPLLLVDQLEGIWANDTDSDAMIIGLLLAAKLVPHRFDRVRCVVFLRSDIYDLLEFGERDKLRGDERRSARPPRPSSTREPSGRPGGTGSRRRYGGRRAHPRSPGRGPAAPGAAGRDRRQRLRDEVAGSR